MQLETSLTTSQLALTAGVLLVAYTIFAFFLQPLLSEQGKYLSSQSWVGLKQQSFAKLRASFDVLYHTRSMVKDGYEQVGMCLICPRALADQFIKVYVEE